MEVKKRASFTRFSSSKSKNERRAELISHLQTALQLEHATIPPYLCALFSIREGYNHDAVRVIRSVVLEEMLHMSLVANILNAIGDGAQPDLLRQDFVPRYPTYLPGSAQIFKIELHRFSDVALEMFLKIERPSDENSEPKHDQYHTVGQFYAAIKDELDAYCHDFGERALFQGDTDHQLSPSQYYNGGGEIIPVTDYASARRALKVIVDEGEGFDQTIFSGDHQQFGEQLDLAHYYKFNEIYRQRRYCSSDSPDDSPSGDPISVEFGDNAVLPVRFDWNHTDVSNGLMQLHDSFNSTYWDMLEICHNAFNGKPDEIALAVHKMYELKYLSKDIMKIPADQYGNSFGPKFRRPKD